MNKILIVILLIVGLLTGCANGFEESFDPNSGSSGDYYLGENDPIITIYEYANWYGTYCNSFWYNIFPEVKEKYIDTGIAKFIFRDLVWDWRDELGEAVECAGDQGKYYEYGAYLYYHPTSSTNDLKQYASNLNLNPTQFNNCLDSGKYDYEVWHDNQHSVPSATPSFVVQYKDARKDAYYCWDNCASELNSAIKELLNEQNIIIAEDDMHINSNTALYSHTYKLKDSGSPGVIIINSSNVIFDCNGSTLIGEGDGYGIYIENFNNVTIKNCIVKNYSYGIYLRNSSNNKLVNNTAISNNLVGIYLIAESNFNRISNNPEFDTNIIFSTQIQNAAPELT